MQINHREIVAPGRGRASLAGQIRAAAALDAQAIDALERAAVAMQP